MSNQEPTWWQKLITLEPALVRGFVTTLFALLATFLNNAFVTGGAEDVINFVIALFALLSAVLIRGAVTPNAKVIVKDETPLEREPHIAPGEGTVRAQDIYKVEQAAKATSDEWGEH